MAISPGSRSFWRVLLWLLGAVAVAALVRVLRGAPSPAFADDAVWKAGADWPPLPEADPPTEPIAAAPSPGSAGPEPSAPEADDLASTPWVEPFEGECPPGYPVKAKLSSGIFHQPGGAMYERTRPDRCYATAALAEADGLRAAKR